MARDRFLILLVGLALVAGAAGCLSEDPAPGDGSADGDASGTASGDEPSSDGDAPSTNLTEEEVRHRIETSFQGIQNESGKFPFSAVEMQVTAEPVNESAERGFNLSFLVDIPEDTMIFEMGGKSLNSSDGMASLLPSQLLVAKVGQKSFMGDPAKGVSGAYNASMEPLDGYAGPSEVASSGGAASAGSSSSDWGPSSMLSKAGDLPPNASLSWEETTYQGRDALEVDVSFENETHSGSYRMVLWTDPVRPALVDGEFRNETAEKPVSRAAQITMTFGYDEEATHPREEALERAATLVYRNATNETGTDSWETPRVQNFTIQPSRDPGSVKLSDVTAVVRNGSSDDPVLTLPLEEGSASSEEARLTYEDADGSGTVTPGDRIVLERRADNASLSLALEDERTGFVLGAPGFPAAGALAVLGLAAAAPRRVR